MIELEPRLLRFLRAGRAIQLEAARPYPAGKTLTVALAGEHRGRLRVQVLKAVADGERFKLTVRQHSREEIWYLTANPGAMRADYTQNPSRAAREPSGGPVEAHCDRTPSSALSTPQRTAERRRREVRSATIQLRDAERRGDRAVYERMLERLAELGQALPAQVESGPEPAPSAV